jgi:predicted metal-dependent peptidase
MTRTDNLTAKGKLKKARIKLGDLDQGMPFFAHITRRLTLVEDEDIPTAGVDFNGNLYFNPAFINTLDLEQIKAILCHEVMHPAFEHKLRKSGRNHRLWNMATDSIINNMLNRNGFDLPKEIDLQELLPDDKQIPEEVENPSLIYPEDGEVVFESIGATISNLDDKNAEQVYSELKDKMDDEDMQQKKKIVISSQQQGGGDSQQGQGSDTEKGEEDTEEQEDGQDTGQQQSDDEQQEEDDSGGKIDDYVGENPEGVDTHIYEEGEDTPAGQEQDDFDWDEALANAAAHAKQRGDMPAGMERHIDEILSGTVNWKDQLRNYLSKEVVTDTTYQRPHKSTRTLRNAGHNTYIPDTQKEGLNVVLTLDLSGSMRSDDIAHYLGEMKDIADTFQQVNMTVIQHDAEVTDVTEYRNASASDIESMDLEGGGGTDHRPVFQYLEEHMTDADIVINLTDGHTLVPDTPPTIDVLWVVDNHNIGKDTLSFGRIVRADHHKGEA